MHLFVLCHTVCSVCDSQFTFGDKCRDQISFMGSKEYIYYTYTLCIWQYISLYPCWGVKGQSLHAPLPHSLVVLSKWSSQPAAAVRWREDLQVSFLLIIDEIDDRLHCLTLVANYMHRKCILYSAVKCLRFAYANAGWMHKCCCWLKCCLPSTCRAKEAVNLMVTNFEKENQVRFSCAWSKSSTFIFSWVKCCNKDVSYSARGWRQQKLKRTVWGKMWSRAPSPSLHKMALVVPVQGRK